MPIKTALITAAGYGSRFFPVSKSVQKEMLPVLNRPVIDYLVDDCIQAGIERIILTVREGQNIVEHYYTEQPKLRSFFEAMGTAEKYKAVEQLHQKAHFQFLIQRDSDGYGTAVPVKLAQSFLQEEEAFLYLTGDDFIFHPNGHTEAAALVELWEKTKAQAVMSCREVAAEDTHRYGIVETTLKEGVQHLTSLVEKPPQGTTTSRLANISKYVLTPAAFSVLANQALDQKSGEAYITDTILELAQTGDVVVHVPQGEYLDCGSVAGWLKANLTLAEQDPELWHEIRDSFTS